MILSTAYPSPSPLESHSQRSALLSHSDGSFCLSLWLRRSITTSSIHEMFFESLPVELIAEILGELDLESLIMMSQLSKRFYLVASDPSLNPWRRPIKRNLSNSSYEKELKHLSVRTTVPRHNWVEILASASPSFILYEATLPHLQASEWEDCFKRRFLPSWVKWKKESSWKEAYLKYVLIYLPPQAGINFQSTLRMLHRIWHRSTSSCTADESWTKFSGSLVPIAAFDGLLDILYSIAVVPPMNWKHLHETSIPWLYSMRSSQS